MGLSSIAVQQREKEDEALKSFIVFSLVGSVGLHVAVLSLSNFWVRETKLATEPIEVIVLDTPKVEAAPEPKPPPKIGGGSKSSAGAKTSNPAPDAISQTASGQEIALSPLAKVVQPSLNATNIEKPLATPQPIPVATPKVAEIPPTPVATPKVTETLPPVPSPQPEVVSTPIPTPTTLPSELIAKLKSTPMPTLAPTPTPLANEKPKPIPSPVAVATPKSTPTPVTTPPQSPPPIRRRASPASASLSPRNNQPPYTPSEKLSNIVKRSNSSVSQRNVTNSNKVGDRSLTPGAQNSAGNNSGSSALARSQPGNNSSGQGNNNSGGGKEKVATAPRNTTQLGEGLSSRPGFGSLACRRCPDPPYPQRAERRGQQGTVKIVFDADRNGNTSNVRVASSSGHDILDRAAIDAVKDWKLASSDSQQQGILQSFTFARKGSDTESLARERRAKQEKERLARQQRQEKERLARQQQQEKERLARQQRQQQEKERQEKERLAREQQRQQQEKDRTPVPAPEPLVTPSTPIPLPTKPSSQIEPSGAPFESSTPSSVPPE